MTEPAMAPRGGSVFLVRWRKANGVTVGSRYYRTSAGAQNYADKLASYGIEEVQIYTAPVTWEHVATMPWWRGWLRR